MKRIIAILLVCLMLLPLVACNNNKTTTTEPQKTYDEENTVHLIVLAGQSGARGKALVSDLSAEDKEPNVDVDILADGLPMGDLVNIPGIDEDTYFEELEPGYGDFSSEFGPEIGMGQTMASAYPKIETEYKSVIVKYTASGSTFTDHWYSSSALEDGSVSSYLNVEQINETSKGEQTGPLTANLYALVEKAVLELTELGYEVVIDGMAFVHGEQDAKFDDNMLIYEKALTHFINDFRAHFDDADMPVVITEALTNSAKHSNTLREIQAKVAENMTNVSFIKTSDLYTNTFEPWHFGAESNIILGNRIAAEILSYNEMREPEIVKTPVLYVPKGVQVELPEYLEVSFTNYYEGYVKVEGYSEYDCNTAGMQSVKATVKTAEGTKELFWNVNVVESRPFIDGVLNEYSGVKANALPNNLGEVYVVTDNTGIYIAAKINDSEIWTDGEKWKEGDMGQTGNNDDFIIYLCENDATSRTTICLSAANLLRVYGNGISLDDSDVTLQLRNKVYNKELSNYSFHVTTDGLMNRGESEGLVLELYISYSDLGIKNPEDIKLCFNYSNVSSVEGVKSAADNYLVKGSLTEEPETSLDSYFPISELTQ